MPEKQPTNYISFCIFFTPLEFVCMFIVIVVSFYVHVTSLLPCLHMYTVHVSTSDLNLALLWKANGS